ncbi:MAG: vWA domain-containing protein, partial [Candidatus Promineifilaceae bacterium]
MIWRLYTLILILILAFPFSVGAQERAREILINYVESTDERDRVGLQIYFTLVDAGGEVVTDAGLRSAEIVTLDQTTPARIDSNLAPLNLIFLLDMSGSMASHFKDMQQAAIRAIEQAPSDAQINIITFDDMNEPDGFQPTGFRSKLNAIEVVRDLRHERSYGTCLYDAIYNSLELMRNQSPDNRTRRAVVAFTDGKDRLRSDNPERCSFHTADDVIRSAGNRELPMPIYTIGLGDIDRDLPDVATQTGGLHIESQSGGLVNAFSKMMTGLTSQWLVSAQAFGIAGDNEGTLKIVLNDGIEISQTFKYWSSNDKLPDPDPTPSPEPPPTILKFDTIPKKEERRYQVDLEASNLSQVFRWELRIYGEDGNKVQEFSYSSDQIDQISFSAETLNPEETYTIELSAFDLDNQIIFNPREGTVLATREFVHWPELLPTPQLEIGHPVIDKEIGILTSTIRTNLNLPINADWRIVDKETGFLVDLTPTLKGVDTYEISLDDLDFGEYILNLSAVDSNGIVIFEA